MYTINPMTITVAWTVATIRGFHVGVVRKAGNCGGDHGQDAEGDRDVGWARQAAGNPEPTQQVKDDGQGEDADGHIRQGGVDGVAQPLSIQEVLDRPDRPKQGVEPAMVEVAKRFRPAGLGIDQPDEEPANHRCTSAAAPRSSSHVV
jgi:hypothetical protein